MSKTTDNAKALRDVYLHTFESHSTDPSEIADQFKAINLRYARELLATLVEAGLVTKSESDGEDVWQVTDLTVDENSLDEAEAKIDEWLGKNGGKPAKPATKTKDESFHSCYCGCGENVPSKSFYRPGHDARHAGQIGREIAANYSTPGFDRRDLLSNLPSEKLVAKAESIAEKQIEKIEAKKAKQAAKDAPEFVEGTLQVGKNERIGRRFKDGTVEYMDEAGEWKPASKTAAKSFAE